MYVRMILLSTLLIPAAAAQPPVDHWHELQDLGKWAMIARAVTDFEEFDLTADQFDQLQASAGEFTQQISHRRSSFLIAKSHLNGVYEVLTEEQESRLHQVMFQRWMGRDDMKTALMAFAPNEVDQLDRKVAELESKVRDELSKTISDLPDRISNQYELLAQFLKWRFKEQMGWLEKELGKERTKQLVGDPVFVGYKFTTKVGEQERGYDIFGDPTGGGQYCPSATRHLSWGEINDSKTMTIVLHPVTGPTDYWQTWGPRPKRPDRPVDVPEGMTLELALRELTEIDKEEQNVVDYYTDLVDEIENQIRDLREQRGLQIEDLREQRGLMELLGKESSREIRKLQAEREKFRAIVQKLGGDPDAEEKRKQAKYTAARNAFYPRVIVCNATPFVSHVDVTAEQFDKLDKIVGDHQPLNTKPRTAESERYYQEVNRVLDERQNNLLEQQLFRQDWFSKNCEKALTSRGVKLEDAQRVTLQKLVKRFEHFQSRQRAVPRRPRGIHLMRLGMRPFKSQGTDFYVLIYKLQCEYEAGLVEVVGAEKAKELLGEQMKYDPNWKRPVVVPEGLTLTKAKEQYNQLVLDYRAAVEDDMERVDVFDEGNATEESGRTEDEVTMTYRKLEIAKRICEELRDREE